MKYQNYQNANVKGNEKTLEQETKEEKKEEKFERFLTNLFKNNERFKFLSIEIYLENPFVFLNRTKEKNVHVGYEYDYLVISKNDKHQTRITSIPLEVIENLNVKTVSNKEYVIEFTIEKINYVMNIELV